MPNWTKDQLSAIEAEEKTILVSAAAGSGKTAVLVERILRLVRDKGAHLSRMLIVTFTRAAAAEMRCRLSERLNAEAAACADDQRPALMLALEELELAKISTIHAFCQDTIRAEFQRVRVDPQFRVLETQERDALFAVAQRDALNGCLSEGTDTPVYRLATSFVQRDVFAMVRQVYTFIMATDDPDRWLQEKAQATAGLDVTEHPWYLRALDQAMMELSGLSVMLDELQMLCDAPETIPKLVDLYTAEIGMLRPLAEAAEQRNINAVMQVLTAVNFLRAPASKCFNDAEEDWKKRTTDIRAAIKKTIETQKPLLELDEVQQENDLKVVTDLVNGLATLTQKTAAHYTLAKQEHRAIDFSDMEQLTLRILREDDCRTALQSQFDYIFVDECQDVSKAQNAIFEALHCEQNALFMVGDVKQSIYRFRLADPRLFLNRVRTFETGVGHDPRKIVLQTNFRSARNVLNATNNVFHEAMRANVTELDYTEEDELRSLRPQAEEAPVEVHLIDAGEGATTGDELISESMAVAGRIKALLNEPFFDGKTVRPYQYRDMCILVADLAGQGEQILRVLESQGIPVFYDGKETYYDLPEIQGFQALLSVIENPMQDVPLLATLRQYPFSMTEEELTRIRRAKPGRRVPFYEAFAEVAEEESPLGQRCAAVQAQLESWRFTAEHMRLSDLMWLLLRETGFYAISGALPRGATRQANLRLLVEKAVRYEEVGGGTLRGFLDWMNDELSSGDATSAKLLGEHENLVRIMTMHKSKGLEFPAVLLMRLDKSMIRAERSMLRLHEELGICLPYVNRDLSIRRNTIGAVAFAHQRRLDELAERCRLLYVAMTRARERLFLYGCVPHGQMPATWLLPPSDLRVWRASSMLDWVMQTVMAELELNALPTEPVSSSPWLLVPEAIAPELSGTQETRSETVQAWIEAARASEVAPPWVEEPQRTPIPVKTSVSALTRQVVFRDPLPLSDAEEEPEGKRQAEHITVPLRLSELPTEPDFMTQRCLNAAERGTAAHRALALLPLHALRGLDDAAQEACISQALTNLRSMHVLSEEEYACIRVADLLAFVQSDLGRRMLAADRVEREWRFNYRLPGRQLLQGVIDCCWLEADGWVICDYKTDYIDNEEAFVARHALQLQYYGQALAALTGTPVKQLWLYAIRLHKALPVELPSEELIKS